MEILPRNKYFEVAGIYRIYHNNKSYVGSSKNLYKRISAHLGELRGNKSPNLKLQNYANKYSMDVLQLEILETFPLYDRQSLLDRETYFINLHDSVRTGFNCLSTADSPDGFKWSEAQKETLKPISAANAVKYRAGLLKNLDKARQSRTPKSFGHRRGVTVPDSTRQKMRNSAIKRGANTGKPVIQYSLDYLYINTYISAHEAERQTGIAFQNIGKCCLGKRLFAGGFRWAFI